MTRSGRAAIEVIGDVSRFASQLKRDLDRAVKGVKVDTRPIGKQITDGVGDAVDRVGDITIDTEVHGDKQAIAALRAVRAAVDEVGDEARETDREMRGATNSGAAGARFLSKAFGQAGVAITSIGSALVGLGASAPTPAGIAAIGAALLGLAAAVPVVIAVGAALADLAGLIVVLPGIIGVAAATMITFKVALNGVADAFQAVLDGDPKKIAEAMKKLAPAARSVVREFQTLLPALRGVQKAIQQSFFAPLKGALTRLAKQSLPTIRTGLSGIGRELGELGRELGRIAGSGQALGFLRRIFASAKAVIDRVTDSVDSMLNIIFRVGNAGLPLIQQFVDWMFNGVDALSAFLSTAEGKSALNKFLSDAVATLKDLWGLVKAVGGLLGAMFGGADDEGRTFIQTLTDITNKMAEFFRSKQGQEFLQNLLDLLPLVAFGLQQFATTMKVVGLHVNSLVIVFGAIRDFLVALPGWISTAAQAVGTWFVNAWNTAYAAVAAFFTAVGAWFTSLPGRIAGWIAAAGNALLTGLRFAFNAALAYVGVSIGLIVFAVARLPGMALAALASLPGILRNLFTAAWNGARAVAVAGFNAIVSFTASFVARVGAVLASLPGRLRSIFASALAAGRAAVVSGFNSIVSVVASAPGRIAGLAGRFVSAGRNIIAGFMRGLSSAGSFAGNVGSAIVSSIRGGLNRVIGSINAGIAGIDAVLPGSLPRIPGLATGGLTTGELLARLHPGELVLPLRDRRAVDLLSQAMARADSGGGSGGGPGIVQAGDVEVRVYLGTREITDIVGVQVDEKFRQVRRRVLAGAGV